VPWVWSRGVVEPLCWAEGWGRRGVVVASGFDRVQLLLTSCQPDKSGRSYGASLGGRQRAPGGGRATRGEGCVGRRHQHYHTHASYSQTRPTNLPGLCAHLAAARVHRGLRAGYRRKGVHRGPPPQLPPPTPPLQGASGERDPSGLQRRVSLLWHPSTWCGVHSLCRNSVP
jgi:hypothetical protein